MRPDEVAGLARIAYEAYARQAGGLTFDGRDMPGWDDVGDKVRANWAAAAVALLDTALPVSRWEVGSDG